MPYRLFFASLTHELKTPLASINLQAQVLSEMIQDMHLAPEIQAKLTKYIGRLNLESTRLEDQLDNHLQLSRIERDAPINMREIPFKTFIEQQFSRYSKQINWKLNIKEDAVICGDDYGVQIIFRNLIENSIKHNTESQLPIEVKAIEKGTHLVVTYNDFGKKFTGDASKLGTLFFKHNSPKGTGIGLYLIQRLMKKMNGSLTVESSDNLIFHLNFMTKVSDAS